MTTDTVQPFHYFASTAFTWAVAPTRNEAIAKCAPDLSMLNKQGKAEGLYCWTVRVDLPQSTEYEIRNYAPRRVKDTNELVPLSDPLPVRIMHTNGWFILAPVETDTEVTA